MITKESIVRRQLSVVIALIELASLALLLVLLEQDFAPQKQGVLLLALLPMLFGLHVMEEFVIPGGFIAWDNLNRPQFTDTPGSYYVKVNALPGAACVLLVLGSFDYRGGYSPFGIRAWLLILTFMSWNAFFHLRGAIHTRRYSPGMVTGLAGFLPLMAISYLYFIGSGAVDRLSALAAVGVALAIQPVLDFIKNHGREKHA